MSLNVPDPIVSVLMLTFNRPQFIGRAIDSIQEQTLGSWELLVVHDGPYNQIEGVMRERCAADNRIRYLRRHELGNIAQANNYGLAQARGTYIAILDDDDYWCHPDKLQRQVDFLEANQQYVACGAGAICIDMEGNETLRYLKPTSDEEIKRVALLANPMVHSTTLFRKSAAESAGFYDESLEGFQDWDLFLKLGKQGKLHNFDDYFLCYQIWEGSGSFTAPKKNTRSALRIVRKHGAHYPSYSTAMAMAMAYHGYAHLPLAARKVSYSFLSRLKKGLFSR
jgi:glycosyltransferase involved in cell wall biosynthesis